MESISENVPEVREVRSVVGITSIDSVAPETEFVVDGKTYRLRYGFEAIAGFEEGTGFNPAVQEFPRTIYNLMSLLYAGLRAHHPEIKIGEVMSWFNQNSAPQLCELAWDSFYGSLPDKEADDTENPLKA